MKIIINATQEELDAMGVSAVDFEILVLERVDSMTHKRKKILHQVELQVESKITKEKK